MSNNINGPKQIAFPVTDQRNLTIIGDNSTILLHGVMMGMVIHDSRNVRISGLRFDWATPFYLQGQVEEVNRQDSSYILQFSPGEVLEVSNSDLIVRRPEAAYYLGGNYWFDPDRRQPVYLLERRKNRFWNPYKGQPYGITRLSGNRFRIRNTVDSLPQPGWHFIAKWRNSPNVNRTAPGIHLQASSEVALEDVSVYSSAGMAIIGEKCTDVTLRRVRVEPTPGSDRIISSTADATHFVNCRGLVRIEDCHFEACLDDGLNIHGNYLTLRDTLGPRSFLAATVHIQQKGFVFTGAGDTLRFIDPSTLLPVPGVVTVASAEQLNDGMTLITTQELLPSLALGYGVENITWVAGLVFRNNVVRRNWARGVLFKTAGKVVIEDNYLSPSMSALRNWGEMNFFNESGSVSDVLIRNNLIENVCRVGNGQPAIVIYPQVQDLTSLGATGCYNRNIRIEDNEIRTFDHGILYAQSVDGLQFVNNRIIQTTAYPPIFPEKPALELRGCREVNICGNVFSPGAKKRKVRLDALSQRTARVTKNIGLQQ